MSAALPQTLEGWLECIEQRHAAAPVRLGLERVQAVLARLPTPSAPAPLIFTVAGTNGKGSVAAMLEAMLAAGGWRVGCYSSPHLLRYNERVRINGEAVSNEALVRAFAAVEAAREEVGLTFFEHGTLAAWCVFCAQALDVLVLEVGLGGRLDAVNVWDADCAIVTTVALDHEAFLGADREAIGLEKAGIFRPGRVAVCGDARAPQTLLEHAERLGTRLWCMGRDFGYQNLQQQWQYWRHQALGDAAGGLLRRSGLAPPALRGANQIANAATALMALECVRERLPVAMQAVRQGLMQVQLPARFQVLPGQPAIVLDVAHNAQAGQTLAANLIHMPFYPRTHAVLAMLADKDAGALLAPLLELVDCWHVASLEGARGQSAAQLGERLKMAGVSAPVQEYETPQAAFDNARRLAGESDRIVVFGSFLTVAQVLRALYSA